MKLNHVQKSTKALTALLLAVMLALPQGAPLYAAAGQTTVHTTTAGLTRAQARDTILAAASHYRDGLKPTDAMSGYVGGAIKETQAVTRLEALVMISRAFGTLPKPGNDWLRATTGEKYADVPTWAAFAFDNLYAGRLLAPRGDGLLNGNEPITAKELDTYLKRVYTLYGTRPQDDFYTAVNKEWLDSSGLEDGDSSNEPLYRQETSAQFLDKTFDRIVSGKWGKGTPERKIADLYKSYLDTGAQTKIGAAPLKPYLGKLAAVVTMSDLEAALDYLSRGTALFPFLTFEFMGDYQDSSQVALYMKSDYDQADARGSAEQRSALAKRLFELAGYPGPTEAAADVERFIKLIAQASGEVGGIEEYAEVTRYSAGGLQKIFMGADIKAMLTSGGVKESPSYVVGGENEPAIRALAKVFTAENIPALRSYAAFRLLNKYRENMGSEFSGAYDAVNGREPQIESPEETAQRAKDEIMDAFSAYFSGVYARENFSAEGKAAAKSMIDALIEAYKENIAGLTWMGEDTKKMAIKKLDAMVVKVGWSDIPENFTPGLEIAGIEDGGSLLGNLLAVERRKLELNIATQGKPVDRSAWKIEAYATNALYDPLNNDITFPAARLGAPFFGAGNTPEENMALLGTVIGHEISHAFDAGGSRFDETGKMADWWAAGDKEEFKRRCEAVTAFYDGAEVAPGCVTSGSATLSENIADLGGLSVALSALKKTVGKPDYKLFFESYTKIYLITTHRRSFTPVMNDDHSFGRVRVNLSVQHFDEFYEAFGVKPGDGMYVAPENRVKVW